MKRQRVTAVIESKSWVNTITGETASIYGACPWTRSEDKPNWRVVTTGWTWQKSDGTVGLGRRPVESAQEAVEIMQRINAL